MRAGEYEYKLYRENDEGLIFQFETHDGGPIDIVDRYDDIELRIFTVNKESNPFIHLVLSDGGLVISAPNILSASISRDQTLSMMNHMYYAELRVVRDDIWTCYLSAKISVEDSGTGVSGKKNEIILEI